MAIEKFGDGGIAVTGAKDIEFFTLLQCQSALRLEATTGLRLSRRMGAATAARMHFGKYGITGRTAKSALKQIDKLVVAWKLLREQEEVKEGCVICQNEGSHPGRDHAFEGQL